MKAQSTAIYFCAIYGWSPQISLDLYDTLDYMQVNPEAPSSTGARTVTHVSRGSYPGAIQPMTAQLGDLFGTKNFEDRFVIYLNADLSVTLQTGIYAGDLLVDQNGVEYEIEQAIERYRLDFLPAYVCRKKL